MNTCDGCKFFSVSDNEWEKPFGSCGSENWKEGYQLQASELKLNQILIENDEGWGALIGPKFGCVHWEAK